MPFSLKPMSQAGRLDKAFSSKRLWTKWETKLWTLNFFMGTCTLYASRVALPICATVMAQEYGWNKTDSGTIMSCFFWGYAITQVIAGGIADLIGGERILTFTTLIWSILTLFTPQLFDFAYWSGYPLAVLLLVRIFTGVGQGFHLPSMASIVSRHLTAADKGRVFGICLAGSHFGSVIAGAIGSILLEWFGWRSLFQFVGIISLIWWFFFKQLKNNSNLRRKNVVFDLSPSKENANDTSEMEHDSISNNASDSRPLIHEKEKKVLGGMSPPMTAVPWGKLFRHKSFWAASVAQYCGANAYFTMFSWLPSYFSDNFPHAKGVVYNVVPSLAIVVTSLIAPFFAARLLTRGKSITFTRRFMESASLIGMALCLLLVCITSTFYTCLMVFTMAMAARGLHHGGVSVNPHDFAPNHTGSVFGIFNAFSAITGFIGVYIAGYILQATNNNWSYVFVFTAVQCVLGAAVYGSLGTGNKII
ncbi:major facilitator superfamily domain-containing protein [Ditylenchus destructor]|uniref:Major facilitator superfamily domain-containing protein n=1 Tax=Ditylenchus destructor TaxID=166010 RepID=A0AAD4MW30_9BILA|nr:major facilitator superfamily domain-containing protein [Ditylenchus destructor]